MPHSSIRHTFPRKLVVWIEGSVITRVEELMLGIVNTILPVS